MSADITQDQSLFQSVVNSMQIGLYIYHLENLDDDHTLRLVFANPASATITGVPADQVVGKTLDENFPGLREKGVPQKYAAIIRENKACNLEDITYSDSRVIQGAFAVKAFPLPNNCVGVAFENIIQQKKDEEQLLIHAKMLDSVQQAVVATDMNGTVTYWNQYAEHLYGWKSDEVIGKPTTQIVATNMTSEQTASLMSALQAGKSWSGEFTVKRKEGTEIKVYVINSPLLSQDKRLIGIVAVSVAMDEIAKVRAEVKNMQAYMDELMNAIADPVFVKNEKHEFVFINDALCTFMGRKREELMGKSDYDFFPKSEADVFWAKDKHVLDTGEINENEESFTDASGVLHTIITKKTLYINAKGEKMIVGVIRDVTEKRKAEEIIKSASKQSEQILESIVDGFVAIDKNWVFTYANKRATEILRKSHAELVGKNIWDIFPDAKTAFYKYYHQAMETGLPLSFEEYFPPLGIWFDEHVYPSDQGISIYFNDITDRKKQEEELKKHLAEIQKLNDLMVGRELKMIELKKEIQELKMQLGQQS
jgi:PAS domain S-box-containing protein